MQAIEVPETLLKKRKQNDKLREEKIAAAKAARKVCIVSTFGPIRLSPSTFKMMHIYNRMG